LFLEPNVFLLSEMGLFVGGAPQDPFYSSKKGSLRGLPPHPLPPT
jgi:hypothetical protein